MILFSPASIQDAWHSLTVVARFESSSLCNNADVNRGALLSAPLTFKISVYFLNPWLHRVLRLKRRMLDHLQKVDFANLLWE